MLYRIFQKKSWLRKTYFECDLTLHPNYGGMICLYQKFPTVDEAIQWAESMIKKYHSEYALSKHEQLKLED